MASVEQVRTFLQSNPQLNDAQIVQFMQQNGIDPGTVIEATGLDPQEAMQRYNAVLPQVQQMQPQGPPTGLMGSEQAIRGGLESALSALMEGAETGRGDIREARDTATGQVSEGFQQGQDMLSPFRQEGERALSLQGALSGTQGREAFDQAYNESPYVEFLREQGERGVTRQAAALGGLGGGNVMKELSRFNQGLAGQGLQQQIGNLQALSGQGLQASGQGANLAAQGGQALGGITMGAGRDLANIATTTGQQAANYGFTAGQNLAQGRTNAGNLLAGNINKTMGNLANINLNRGQGFASTIGQGGDNIVRLLAGTGMNEAQLAQALAQSRAQLGMQASGQYAGLPGIPGVQETQGIGQNIANTFAGFGSGMESLGTL